MESRDDNFSNANSSSQRGHEFLSRLNELQNEESDFQRNNPSYDTRELDNIMLEENAHEEANNSNKKRYIVLALILVVLFLTTIIILRVVTNKSSNDSFVDGAEESINSDKIENEYKKIFDKRLEIQNEDGRSDLSLEDIEKEEQKVVVEKNPENIQKAKELKEDIFKIKNGTKVTQPKKADTTITQLKKNPEKEIDKIIAQKRTVKATPKPKVKEVFRNTTKTTSVKPVSSSSVKGNFIQIGAFSQPVKKEYLTNITSKGLQYKLYKVVINKKVYTKVLIGPYRNKSHARASIPSVKQKLKIENAFLLSL